MTRFWITTHWPPNSGESEEWRPGIWLKDGTESVGASIAPGDFVIVYQSKSGDQEVLTLPGGKTERRKRSIGREGIIHYGRVLQPLAADSDAEPKLHGSGRQYWWRWYAPIQILSRSGSLPRTELCRLLGYLPTHTMRGFGTRKSGLLELNQVTFESITNAFHMGRPCIPRGGNAGHGFGDRGGSGESPEHKNLKEFVAANPSIALNERELSCFGMEFEFSPWGTSDKADVVLIDTYHRIIGVEIEPHVLSGEFDGVLQAIKYRGMLEVVFDCARGDSRGFLVTYEGRIAPPMKDLCNRYGVEVFEVSSKAVEEFVRQNAQGKESISSDHC